MSADLRMACSQQQQSSVSSGVSSFGGISEWYLLQAQSARPADRTLIGMVPALDRGGTGHCAMPSQRIWRQTWSCMCTGENIFITNSFRQTLVYLMMALLGRGSRSGRRPTNLQILALLEQVGAEFLPCAVDDGE